ncbi:protein spotted leaf 11-like isoform X1 [Lolium perenne]|uniref:protein spotted leaf 11-like isoform X1 n=1 Tax=Lolium perenne TaxID=4522 RepID=UPI003A98F398
MAGDRDKEPTSSAPERVARAVEAVAAAGEFRNAYRRQLLALSRRIRLLGPFAEELRERRRRVDETEERALAPLAAALERALDLLRLGRDGSRISLVSSLQKLQAASLKLGNTYLAWLFLHTWWSVCCN